MYIPFNLNRIITNIWQLTGIYFIWLFIHYFASWLYPTLCTPWGFIGFIITPFFVSSPHCQALRWCIIHGAETISSMWIIFGTWIIAKLLPITN